MATGGRAARSREDGGDSSTEIEPVDAPGEERRGRAGEQVQGREREGAGRRAFGWSTSPIWRLRFRHLISLSGGAAVLPLAHLYRGSGHGEVERWHEMELQLSIC